MFYTHVNEEGKVEEDSSSLPEVKRWVMEENTNL
jgi:hypothetical protein